MEQSTGFTGARWLRAVGDASYSIYLSHILSLSCCIQVWKRCQAAGTLVNLFALTMMALTSLAIGFASYQFIERPVQRMLGARLRRHAGSGWRTSMLPSSE